MRPQFVQVVRRARSFSWLVGLCVVVLFFRVSSLAASDEWAPVDPADLASKSSVVEKDADAEAIFWEVYLDDAPGGLELRHYIRIKIFTERARQLQSNVKLLYPGNFEIRDISGRTIKPDGSIINLMPNDVFEQNVVNARGVKVKARTFVLPGVEVGAIIEYRWREVEPGRWAHYIRLPFQRDVPIRQISYHFRPRLTVGAMRFRYFQMPATGLINEYNGFYRSTRTNVPAFRDEPQSPPQDQIRSWLLVYYVPEQRLDVQAFWNEFGRSLAEISRQETKVDDHVRRAAQEAVGAAVSPDEKLENIFNYCRARVKNIYAPESGLSAEERAKRKENKSPAETLKRGQGSGGEISILFAALAAASGFESQLALLSDRSDIFFDSSFPDSYFLNGLAIAVKVGNGWRFFDPGNPYLPYGMIPWWREDTNALVGNQNGALFVKTPMSPPDKSVVRRTGMFRLTEDGTLEGDARVEYWGHLAAEKKSRNREDSQTQREQTLRDEIKSHINSAELSDIKVQAETDPAKPFAYGYHIRIPGYAQRTARRIFLVPALFEQGIPPRFATSFRKNAIYFNYPWTEEDDVTIELPREYTVDDLGDLQPFKIGTTSEYKSSITVSKESHQIAFRRSFFFGGDGKLLFPATDYAWLKEYFDAVNKLDNHMVTLTQQ